MNQLFNWNSRSVVNNLIALNVVVFLAQWLSPRLDMQLVGYLGLHSWGSDSFYFHQLITYMFLHGGVSHLFFNMFALWMFGRISESDMGSKRFLTYYMVTGVCAGAATLLVYWLTGTNAVMIGASGAVYGVLLSFGLMHPNDRIMLLIPPIPMRAKYFVMIIGVVELYQEFMMNDNVAHFAHVSGMLFGFILLHYWKRKGRIYY